MPSAGLIAGDGRGGRRLVVLAALALGLASARPTGARVIENDLSSEVYVANALSEPAEGYERGLPYAILPQVGFGPETGPKAGVKLEGHELFGRRTFADLNLLVALELQQELSLTVGTPELGRFLVYGTASYARDPGQEFFGIGNNDVGPEELSNHDIRRGRIGLTVGYRLLPQLALSASGFYRETDVKRGKDDDSPSTTRFAPGLPGIGGARSSYLSLAVVYSSRDEVVRPTRGWRALLKFLWADQGLGNDDADFRKLILDLGYVVPLVWRRQVIALHGNTEVMFGDDDEIPFFELSSLGGADTMRGYFPQRFLGKGRMLFNAEYRLKLVDFDFRRLWDVSIDGVGFGDAGRVYDGPDDFLEHTFDRVRYSWGGGVRVGFSSGLVARIDVGFSPEERGLLYLSFGHTF
jgi:outer membrane protein assembly factor BamA